MITFPSHSDQPLRVKTVPPSLHVFVAPVVREIPPGRSEPSSLAQVW